MSKLVTQSHLRFPLDNILGTAGNVRVLRALYAFGGPLSVSQLAANTKLTAQGVRLVLEALVGYDMVQVLGQGRAQLYQAVTSHPWAIPLRALFLAEKNNWSDMLTRVRYLLQSNAQVAAGWIYGSFARGEDKPASDIDIAVLLHPAGDEGPVREAFEQLSTELHKRFSVVCITEADLATGAVGGGWWSNVLREGRQLKGEGRFAGILNTTAPNQNILS